MMAKAKVKALKKNSEKKAMTTGERLFIDTSGPFPETMRGNRYWVKIVEDTMKVKNINKDTKDVGEIDMLAYEKDAKMYLTLSCEKGAFTQIVNKPTAYEMMNALKERYEPKEEDDYLVLAERFLNCKLKNEDYDPEDWFHELEYICERMKDINEDYEKRQ